MKDTESYSLVELMVIIGIITALSVVAWPAYKEYVVKAKVGEVVKILQIYMEEIQREYARSGNTPADVSGFTSDSFNSFPTSGLIQTIMYNDGSDSSYNTDGAHIEAYVSDEICSYVSGCIEATTEGGTDGTKDRIVMSFAQSAENINIVYCGNWLASSNSASFNMEYLPAGCKTENISSVVNGF